jgi:hypothetical protein
MYRVLYADVMNGHADDEWDERLARKLRKREGVAFPNPTSRPISKLLKAQPFCKDPRPHVYWGHLAALLGDGRRLGRWQMIMKESSRCASLA